MLSNLWVEEEWAGFGAGSVCRVERWLAYFLDACVAVPVKEGSCLACLLGFVRAMWLVGCRTMIRFYCSNG